MTVTFRARGIAPLLLAAGAQASAGVLAQQAPQPEPLVIQEQIVAIYGDNIAAQPTRMPVQDSRRVRLARARAWRDTVNKHGGDVTVVHLPKTGIRGNTHCPFSDLNTVQIADSMSKFLG